MKDEHLTYELYRLPEDCSRFRDEYEAHMVALYLNICSCLTKANKKEDAIHSAEEALQLKETAKGYYKKAQAYLQFINREDSDIKLGFYYLNKCYELSKDQAVVQEMHKIKRELDQERNKEKEWFKFMFDKNARDKQEQTKQLKPEKKVQEPSKEAQEPKTESAHAKAKDPRAERMSAQMAEMELGQKAEPEDEKLERTKEKLFKFANLDLTEEQWLESYEGEFIAKHGSKIYSIIQLLGQREALGEYRAMFAQCLECKKDSLSISKRKEAYGKYF
jgi:hypothetical protein